MAVKTHVGEWVDLIGTHASPASVNAGVTRFPDNIQTNGVARYARFVVNCSKSHTVNIYGWRGAPVATPVDISSADLIQTTSGKADNSAYHGDSYLVCIAGFHGVLITVTNNDGAVAANVWAQGCLVDVV